MPKEALEVIEVVDTAVKIGLAGFFTGLTAYLVSKSNIKKELKIAELNKLKDLETIQLNHKHEMKKKSFENKMKMVDDMCELMEEYFNSLHALTGHFGAKILNQKITGIEKNEEKDIEYSKGIIEVFTDSYHQKNKALSKIKILQITDAQSAIHDCALVAGKYLECLRQHSKLGKPLLSEDLNDIIQEVVVHKDNFYSAINKYVESISK